MSKFKIVFSDFDGTLTYNESLRPVFFELLNFLESKKTPLVIVTGRSLSWGHFLLTHFPHLLDVIVEGGGTMVSRGADHRITEDCLISNTDVERLAHFCLDLKKQFPHLSLSADSFGRKTDRAIELYDLTDPGLFSSVKEFMRAHKINFSTSNVHLNFWCGEINKYTAVTHYLKKHNVDEAGCIFFGDSLNDQAMFKSFHHSVGVSNIASILDRLEHKPKVILSGVENIGPFGVLNYLQKEL